MPLHSSDNENGKLPMIDKYSKDGTDVTSDNDVRTDVICDKYRTTLACDKDRDSPDP